MGVVFNECERRHHSKEEHYPDELLPQPLRVGVLERGSLLVGVLQDSSPFPRRVGSNALLGGSTTQGDRTVTHAGSGARVKS